VPQSWIDPFPSVVVESTTGSQCSYWLAQFRVETTRIDWKWTAWVSAVIKASMIRVSCCYLLVCCVLQIDWLKKKCPVCQHRSRFTGPKWTTSYRECKWFQIEKIRYLQPHQTCKVWKRISNPTNKTFCSLCSLYSLPTFLREDLPSHSPHSSVCVFLFWFLDFGLFVFVLSHTQLPAKVCVHLVEAVRS